MRLAGTRALRCPAASALVQAARFGPSLGQEGRGGVADTMKLMWAVVQKDDAGALINALTKREYRVTRIDTAGGFLKEKNATVITAVEDDQVEAVMSIIAENCQTRTKTVNPLPPIMEPGEFYVPYPVEVEVGGATVLVLNLADFHRL